MPCNVIGSEYCSCLYAFLMWEKIWMSYICEHFDTKSLWQQKRNGKNFGTDMKNFRGQDLVRATLAINEKKRGELCNPYPRIKAITRCNITMPWFHKIRLFIFFYFTIEKIQTFCCFLSRNLRFVYITSAETYCQSLDWV